MKKLFLASAIAALSMTAAHAAPTIYGKAFLTLDTATGDFKDRTQLNSNGSRIGLKGAEALTANTDLVYQLEYGVQVDDNSAQFKSRDTYLGLSNKQYGTLLAGRLTAIDDNVNYANVTKGGVLAGDDVLAFTVGRANNTFAYVSPTYNNTKVLAMYTLDENNATDTLDHDAFGVAVQHEQDQFDVGASYIKSGPAQQIRVSGDYNVTPALKVGALYQNAKLEKKGKKENAVAVSAKYKTATPLTVYGQVDLVSHARGTDRKDQRLVVGSEYALNNATTAHIYGAYQRDKVASTKESGFGLGGGIEYKF